MHAPEADPSMQRADGSMQRTMPRDRAAAHIYVDWRIGVCCHVSGGALDSVNTALRSGVSKLF
jgi:hypothetical protein